MDQQLEGTASITDATAHPLDQFKEEIRHKLLILADCNAQPSEVDAINVWFITVESSLSAAADKATLEGIIEALDALIQRTMTPTPLARIDQPVAVTGAPDYVAELTEWNAEQAGCMTSERLRDPEQIVAATQASADQAPEHQRQLVEAVFRKEFKILKAKWPGKYGIPKQFTFGLLDHNNRKREASRAGIESWLRRCYRGKVMEKTAVGRLKEVLLDRGEPDTLVLTYKELAYIGLTTEQSLNGWRKRKFPEMRQTLADLATQQLDEGSWQLLSSIYYSLGK